MRNFLFLCLLAGLLMPDLYAQPTLEVNKSGTRKHFYFQHGDSLCVQLKKQPEPICSPWTYIDQETIWMSDTLVSLKDIEWVDIAEKRKSPRRWNLVSNFLITAGLGYFAIDQLNSLVVEQEKFSISDRVLKTSGGFVAGGLLVKLIIAATEPEEKARIGKKYKIYLTDHE